MNPYRFWVACLWHAVFFQCKHFSAIALAASVVLNLCCYPDFHKGLFYKKQHSAAAVLPYFYNINVGHWHDNRKLWFHVSRVKISGLNKMFQSEGTIQSRNKKPFPFILSDGRKYKVWESTKGALVSTITNKEDVNTRECFKCFSSNMDSFPLQLPLRCSVILAAFYSYF